MSAPTSRPDPPSPPSPRPSRGSGIQARWSTLALTNLTKLVGLGLAVNEAAIRANARDSVIGFCALCVLGAQVAENIILRVIDRVLASQGLGEEEPPAEDPPAS